MTAEQFDGESEFGWELGLVGLDGYNMLALVEMEMLKDLQE